MCSEISLPFFQGTRCANVVHYRQRRFLLRNFASAHNVERREVLLISGFAATRREAQALLDPTLCDFDEPETQSLCARSERGEFQFGRTLAFEYDAESGFDLAELERVARAKKLFRVGSLARQ